MDPILAIVLAAIGVSGVILTAILTFVNTRRSNDLKRIEMERAADLKKVELDQARLQAEQEREAAKRKESSEKHQRDMERVAALEAKSEAQDAALDRLRGKFTLLWQHALELNQFIYEGKPPPPPPFPPGLLE
jgi:hypothetical protein